MYFPKDISTNSYVKNLEVGKEYLVPYVWVTAGCDHPDIRSGELSIRGDMKTPIIGDAHFDDEDIFENTFRHFHVDMRFISDEDLPYLYKKDSDNCLVQSNSLKILEITLPPSIKPVFWDRFICYRIGYPGFFRQPTDIQQRALSEHFKDKKLFWNKEHNCWQCPHQGFLLCGQPVVDNIIGCLGHGLHFDVRTKEVVGI
jgi:hypothetical protein